MCKTVMLYLGNNLYGTLRHKPFTLDRPIQFLLQDIQRMRLLHHDVRQHKLHLEICMDSDYELLLNEEEIIPLAETKPELLPESATPTLFDADYIPPGTDFSEPTIKTEAFENLNIIGHITNQPPLLAKQIKQEFIDTAAYNVLQKHTHECALNKFVQERQSEMGLHIEDIRTLITADNSTNIRIKSEPTEPPTEGQCEHSSTGNLKPLHVVTDLTSEAAESDPHQEPLLEVTAAAKESLNNPAAVNEPLLLVTSGLTLDQAGITEYHPANAPTRWSCLLNKPVPVSPTDTPSNQSASTVSQLVFPEPEIHVSKATEGDTSQGLNIKPPSATICGNIVDKSQIEDCTTDASPTLRDNSDITELSDTVSGKAPVSETSQGLNVKPTSTTTHGNTLNTILTEG